MSKPALIAAGLALAMSGLPAQAQYAPMAGVQGNWSPRAAESQCKNQLRSQYGVSNTRAVTTNDRGNGRYQVTGNADRNNQTSNFDCWVESNSVRNLTMGNWQNYNGNNNSGNAVAAVGAALVLGALIAAASSKKKSHEYDQYPDGYGNGNDDSYSPAGGINCYRQQRACFDGNNNYNAGWTSREFGY